MGGGSWTKTAFESKVIEFGFSDVESFAESTAQEVYKQRALHRELDPYDVIRECRDCEEHPNTLPVILALDVTGSMGYAAVKCAAKLDEIMEELYGKVKDVEFLVMGIGDLAFDRAPIQATQFESDIRILDQTAKIWFEAGGGSNAYESYTAAWYFGLHNTDLDCWKRGKKGIIITIGDEPLNPYLPCKKLLDTVGDHNQSQLFGDVKTDDLYKQACEKFDIYHIVTGKESTVGYYQKRIDETWKKLLGQRCLQGSCDDLPKLIGQIVEDHVASSGSGKIFDTLVRW